MYRLNQDEVHLWRISIDEVHANTITDVLCEQERTRSAGYRCEEQRREFAVTRATLRCLLAAYTGKPAGHLRFAYGEHGKPLLDGGVEFNVSHSRSLAVIAIARFRVGVDVEGIDAELDWANVAKHFLSAVERGWIARQAPDRQVRAFLQCWTQQEACCKAMGSGLYAASDHWYSPPVANKDEARALSVRTFSLLPRHIGCIAAARERFVQRLYDWKTDGPSQ